MIPLLVFGLLLYISLQQSEAVGICYGTPGINQPPPTAVVPLLEKHNITKVRLYEPNQDVLTALKGKNIEVLLGVPNSEIMLLAVNPEKVESWVRTNVKAYYPAVKIKYLVVGNDIGRNNDNNGLSFFLMYAIMNFQNSLSKDAGLKDIKITSSFDTSILRHPYTDSPSNISLVAESLAFLDPFLKFISGNGAPFMVNLYPYYGHILNPAGLTLDYALFKAPNGNLFEALLDSMYSALAKAGSTSVEIVVAETGWPSQGGVATSVENQRTYVTNLLQYVKKGTPKNPNKPIETFLFSMFDDDVVGVPAPEVERHFGLFTPNKELKFVFTGSWN